MSIFRTVVSSIFRRDRRAAELSDFSNFSATQLAAGDHTIAPVTPTATADRTLFGGGNAIKLTLSHMQANGKPKTHILVGTLDELHQITVNPPPKKTVVMLTGELVLLSDSEVERLDNYSRQTDRITKSFSAFSRRAIPFTLKVWLHRNVVEVHRSLKRTRFCFAIDQYLHYGKQQKGDLRLVTGHCSDSETIIHVFKFEKGNLVAIDEKVLPSRSHPRFASDYAELLNGLRRDEKPITIIDPLPNLEQNPLAYVDSTIYQTPIQYLITDETAKPKFLSLHGIPIAIATVSLMAYVFAMVIPYNNYSYAQVQFQRVAATIPKSDLIFGSDELKTMQERRQFLTADRPQQEAIQLIRQITAAYLSEGFILKNIELDQKKVKADDPDIVVTAQIKRAFDQSPYDQAAPIFVRLKAKTGITFRLSRNPYQEQKGTDGDFIVFNIEANLKDKA